MPRRAKSEAFDIKLSADAREQLASELCDEVEQALSARADVIADGGQIDLVDWFYEQGQSDPADRPFPGAADLTSYFITENVDAYQARLVDTVFDAEPFCAVEAWGQDASKAPYVEQFHEWQVVEEGLQEELSKVALGALIEDCCVLEVRERVETRRIVEEIDVALQLNEQGGPIFEQDAKGKVNPALQMDPKGEPVPAQDGQPSARVKRSYTKTKRLGPEYDVISMKDFVFLPGHARNMRQIWGSAKRFHARVPELLEKVQDGIYDADAVDLCGEESDRDGTQVTPVVSDVGFQRGPSAEKELWELSLKRDLDGDGREEWYVLTLSLKHRALLRCKLDTFVMKLGISRCVPFVLFPRRNSVYGYSYAYHKLISLAEEHTALRNMKADRGSLATNAPFTVIQGAMVDFDAQPFGVGRRIDVHDHNDIRQLQVADVPNSVVEQERNLVAAKERVGGLADTAIGVQSAERRTLGENQMVSGGSAVRVKCTHGHWDKAIQRVMMLRHQIWVDTLEADAKGLEAPVGVQEALQVHGMELDEGRFTATQIKGKFRFKPSGSVETADPAARIQYFNQGLIALSNLAKICPPLAMILQNYEAAKTILDEWARVFKVRNRMAFLNALQPPAPMGLPAAGGMGPGAPQPEMGAPAGQSSQIAALMAALGGAQADGYGTGGDAGGY